MVLAPAHVDGEIKVGVAQREPAELLAEEQAPGGHFEIHQRRACLPFETAQGAAGRGVAQSHTHGVGGGVEFQTLHGYVSAEGVYLGGVGRAFPVDGAGSGAEVLKFEIHAHAVGPEGVDFK